jgi:hypothetical protein
VVHETKALEGTDIADAGGIPVTTPERTLLDLGAVCHASVVEMALDAAEHRGLVTRRSVQATSTASPSQGEMECELCGVCSAVMPTDDALLRARWRRC